MANKVQKYLMTLVMAVLVIALFVGVITATGLVAGVAAADDVNPIEQRSSRINLGDFDTFHWVLKGHNSDLRSGRIYVYSYKDVDNNPLEYYTMTQMSTAPNAEWKEWMLTDTRNVYASIVRYRTDNSFDHEIEIFSSYLNEGFTVSGYSNDPFATRGTDPGKYVAQVTLDAQDGFEFYDGTTTGATAQDRGMKITIQDNGKRAVIEKEWYIAIYDNALLDGFSTIGGGEVDFDMPSWTFGDAPNFRYPLLRHGDALITDAAVNQPENYTLMVDGQSIVRTNPDTGKVEMLPEWDPRKGDACTHDIVTFTLINTDTHQVIVQDARRSQWNYYFNNFVPVGNYALTIEVASLTLGSHLHWFADPNSSDYVHEEPEGLTSDYIGFERTFNFSVSAGTLNMNDKDFNFNGTQKAPFEINVTEIESTHDAFFAPANAITFGGENFLTWEDVRVSNTYWSEQKNAELYDMSPTLMFSLHRMRDPNYYPATSTEWSGYIVEPSLYTVYYIASMKNYKDTPNYEDRYENYYKVKLYQVVDVPTLNRYEMIYTGGKLSVLSDGANTRLFALTGNEQVDAGDYTAVCTFYEPEYYKWRVDSDTVYDFNTEYTIDWKISPAVVEVPTLAERYYTGNSMTPTITIPKNQNTKRDIFAVSYPEGYSDGRFTDADTYNITLTLESANNYVWENQLRTPPANRQASITIPFVINKFVNEWEISPSIRHWQWKAYDKDVNILTGAAARGGVLFTVYTDKECTKPAAGLESFAVVNGVVTDVTAEAFARLNAGDYYLLGKVVEGKNYTGITSEVVNFNVGVARNNWVENVNIIRWSYGSFDAKTNIITGTPRLGERVVWSIVTRNGEIDTVVQGLDNIQINENGEVIGAAAEVLAGLDAGYYHLIARVEREIAGYTDGDITKPIYNYMELNGDIEFRVSRAQNFWEDAPKIARWIIGENINLPTAVPHFGVVRFVIYNNKDEVIYDSQIGDTTKLATTHTGWHTLETTVAGNDNYTELSDRKPFRVFGTDVNYWLTVPNIQGWKVGETPNAPVAEAAHGTVTFKYMTADGKELDGAPTQAGDYILVATATSEDAGQIVAQVKFSVFAKSTAEARDTALIAVVSVFSVIIAGGIIAAVVMIVLAKKRKKANPQATPFVDNGEI